MDGSSPNETNSCRFPRPGCHRLSTSKGKCQSRSWRFQAQVGDLRSMLPIPIHCSFSHSSREEKRREIVNDIDDGDRKSPRLSKTTIGDDRRCRDFWLAESRKNKQNIKREKPTRSTSPKPAKGDGLTFQVSSEQRQVLQ